MNMYEIRGSLTNFPGHSRTYRNRRDVKGRAGPSHPNPVYQFIPSPPVVARDNHPHINRPLELLTQGLKVRLNATHVRRVKLAELEHTQPRCAHANSSAFDDTQSNRRSRPHLHGTRGVQPSSSPARRISLT